MSGMQVPDRTDRIAPDTVGVIGLGLVGSALAGNLLELGIRVIGYDIVPEKILTLRDAGGIGVESAAEVGRECELVFVSVLTAAQSASTIAREDGLLSPGFRTEVILDTTTADPEESIRISEAAAERGVAFLDAPLSGSSSQIRNRDAVFLIGGDEAVYLRLHGFLASLSRSQFYLGPAGAGSRAKIASNLVLGLNRLALAEGLVFAERLGLDPGAFLDLLRDTPAYSRAIDIKGAKMLAGDFSPQSKISQHRKDLDIILDYSRRLSQPLPLAKAHHDILSLAESNGLGDLDTCAVIEQIRRLSSQPDPPAEG